MATKCEEGSILLMGGVKWYHHFKKLSLYEVSIYIYSLTWQFQS